MTNNESNGAPNVEAFKDYIERGRLLSLATTDGTRLRMCSCWYAASSDLSRLYFISRKDRLHSVNIRNNGLVSGSIIAIELEGLGQKTQGIFLSGNASECTGPGLVDAYGVYAARWPQVRDMFTAEDVESDATPMRVFEVTVEEYVFVDEVSDPVNVRKIVPLADLADD